MLRSVSAFVLVLLMGVPAFADGMEISRPRYRHYGIYLPPERHVIEVVRPPYSANFIINGAARYDVEDFNGRRHAYPPPR